MMQTSAALALLLVPSARGFSSQSCLHSFPATKCRTAFRYFSLSSPSTTTTKLKPRSSSFQRYPPLSSTRSSGFSSVTNLTLDRIPITSKTIRFCNSRETTNRNFLTTTLAASGNRVVEAKDREESDEDNELLLLPYDESSHNSVTIIIPEKDDAKRSNTYQSFDSDDNDNTLETFRRRLEATIVTCRHLAKSSLWIQVPMSNARIIEAMVEISGLEFHHAEGTIAHMCIWLKDDVECKIPDYGTHQVGVGAILINSRNEILCVRELNTNYRRWKIPTGLANLGEQLDEAIVREVMEETGIQSEFKSVLAVWHKHGMQFNRSDLYFACELQLNEGDNEKGKGPTISEPVAEKGEISETAWVPLEEYMKVIYEGGGHPVMQKIMKLRLQDTYIKQSIITMPGKKPSPIYHISEHDNVP